MSQPRGRRRVEGYLLCLGAVHLISLAKQEGSMAIVWLAGKEQDGGAFPSLR